MTKSATLTQLGNDLFWEFYTPTKWNPDHSIKAVPQRLIWEGYNDSHWWQGVCSQPWYRQQQDDQGNTWEIDFHTNQVTLNQ